MNPSNLNVRPMVCARFDQSGTVFRQRLTCLAVKARMILTGFLPAGPAFFAAAGEFVYRGPSPRFRGFRNETIFLAAGFNVFRLTLLFVSVAEFIALRHGWSAPGVDYCFGLRALL